MGWSKIFKYKFWVNSYGPININSVGTIFSQNYKKIPVINKIPKLLLSN